MRAVLDVVYICHTNSCTFGDVKWVHRLNSRGRTALNRVCSCS